MDNNIKLTAIGQWQELPKSTVAVLKQAMEKTKHNTGLVLNLAMNYGAKDEIVSAVNQLITQSKSSITQEDIEGALMTSSLPPVDLCIRTGGEQRLSNFLLWQLAYSELYFTDIAWPAFSEEHFEQAIEHFIQRDRRFGGL